MLKNIFEVLSRAWSEILQLQHKMLGGALMGSSVPAAGTAGSGPALPRGQCCSHGRNMALEGPWEGEVCVCHRQVCAALAKHLGFSIDVLTF